MYLTLRPNHVLRTISTYQALHCTFPQLFVLPHTLYMHYLFGDWTLTKNMKHYTLYVSYIHVGRYII